MFLHLCVILFTRGLCPSMHQRSHDHGSLSRRVSVPLSRGVPVQGVSVQGGGSGIYVWGSLSRGRSLSGGLCPGGLCLGVSIQGVSVQGISVQGSLSRGLCSGGLCLGGGFCPGGLYRGEGVSARFLSRRRSLSWGLCPVGLCPEQRPPRQRPSPPYGNVQVACIVLECILFVMYSVHLLAEAAKFRQNTHVCHKWICKAKVLFIWQPL